MLQEQEQAKSNGQEVRKRSKVVKIEAMLFRDRDVGIYRRTTLIV